MKAALQHKNGDPTSPDVLSVVDDAAVPEPAAGQVLVKVSCASVNPIDYKLVAGDFPGKKEGPFGCDVSGTVAKLGPGCDAFKVGDRVYADAIKTPGSFAEYALVPAEALGRMPKNISFKEAAALPLAGLTALQAFQTHGKLKEGQKVAVLGGSGGVGSLAVQIAKALGAAHVYATGSAVDLIKGLGADTVINYKEQDVVAAMTGLELDIVFDTVGGYDNWIAGQAALKTGGIYLTIVGDGGSIASIMASMLFRNVKGGAQIKSHAPDSLVDLCTGQGTLRRPGPDVQGLPDEHGRARRNAGHADAHRARGVGGAQAARRCARLRADHGRRRRHRQGVHDAPHQGQARPHRVQAVDRPPRSAAD